MEQNNETKGEKKYSEILLRTVRNGYSLDVEREGYMYHDLESLLEGVIIHVGMGRVAEATKEEIQQLINHMSGEGCGCNCDDCKGGCESGCGHCGH